MMKKLVALVLACLVLVSATACLAVDTTTADGGWTASNWAKEEVSQADAAGLLPDVLAKADLTQPITRLEYAHAIIALYTARTGEDPTLQDSRNIAFPDCNDPAVRAADRLGLIAGFPDGTFRPDDPLTREQAAVLLDRVLDATKGALLIDGLYSWSDSDKIGSWAAESVETLAKGGVLQGRADGTFGPKDSLTRQEAVILDLRLVNSCLKPVATGDFTTDLFGQVKGQNVVLSPASAAMALGLVQAGAQGETKAELDRVLTGTDPAKLYAALTKATKDGPTVEVANSLWFDTSVSPKQSYLSSVKATYGAESQTLDLPTKDAMDRINAWVKAKTHDLIPTLLNELLADDQVAVLLNALYFKGDWVVPFDKESTRDLSFTTAGGKTVTVPFLRDTRTMSYLDTDACTGVILPYRGEGDWSLIALLPKDGHTAAELASSDFAALAKAAQDERVALALPKFTLEGTYDLTDALKGLGLTTAFSGAADLSGIGTCAKGDLYLSQVLQKTYLRVDEKGTEAAAVTSAAAGATSAPIDPPVELIFDRPFLACLWNGEAAQALFLAQVDDPS